MSRDKIIGAAIRVFSKEGYYRASMDVIAREADVAKGTLYYHFPTKLELFKSLVTEGMTMITDKIKNELNENTPVEIQLKKAIEANIDLYLEYGELAKIFFNELSSGIDADALAEIDDLKNEYISFIADILKSVSDNTKSSVNYNMVASGMLGMLDTVCKYYLKNSDKTTPGEIRDFMLEIISSWLYKRF